MNWAAIESEIKEVKMDGLTLMGWMEREVGVGDKEDLVRGSGCWSGLKSLVCQSVRALCLLRKERSR
jgi:hypothetical protein